MVNELEIEKWLKDNFIVEFVNTPSFQTIEFKEFNGRLEVNTKFYEVQSYLINNGIESLKKLFESGVVKKVYILRDELSRICFLRNSHIIMRMHIIQGNKRYYFRKNKNNKK